MTLGSPSATSYPVLHCKAADSRIIVGWLGEECQRAPDVGELYGKRRASLAWYQREFAESMEQSPRYLNDHQIARITAAGTSFLQCYVSFAEECEATNVCRYKLLRKVHPMMHLLEDMGKDRLNCRFFAGWVDETLMGKVIKMCDAQDSRQAIHNVLCAYWPMYIERARAR